MTDAEMITRYNYDEFIVEKISHWLNFDNSPMLGEAAPDFPLWDLKGRETKLKDIWSANTYTIVEFGSFT